MVYGGNDNGGFRGYGHESFEDEEAEKSLEALAPLNSARTRGPQASFQSESFTCPPPPILESCGTFTLPELPGLASETAEKASEKGVRAHVRMSSVKSKIPTAPRRAASADVVLVNEGGSGSLLGGDLEQLNLQRGNTAQSLQMESTPLVRPLTATDAPTGATSSNFLGRFGRSFQRSTTTDADRPLGAVGAASPPEVLPKRALDAPLPTPSRTAPSMPHAIDTPLLAHHQHDEHINHSSSYDRSDTSFDFPGIPTQSSSTTQSQPVPMTPPISSLPSTTGSGAMPSASASGAAAAGPAPTPRRRRFYPVGDRVLVCNHQSRWANLVNRYGFPPGQGGTADERAGPYLYVLATVKKVHFEEDSPYYTVTRADTGLDHRAEGEWIEPLLTESGERAALRAATQAAGPESEGKSSGKYLRGMGFPARIQTRFQMAVDPLVNATHTTGVPRLLLRVIIIIFWPVFCIVMLINGMVGPRVRGAMRWSSDAFKNQAAYFLNGLSPYSCSIRFTAPKFLVLCCTWYNLVDQARLGFCPPGWDETLAYISFFVWIVLLLELSFEVFIRPDGYSRLILSDQAFAPSTLRYISTFHVVVEAVSLVAFVPEFWCVLGSQVSCGDRLAFSCLEASVYAVLGPTRLDAFYGRMCISAMRLRVFGLVRHWKQAWINSAQADPNWNRSHRGIISFVLPRTSRRKVVPVNKANGKIHAKAEYDGDDDSDFDEDGPSPKRRSEDNDDHLKNATNIGLALMVINSQRALLLLVAIVGFLPVIFTIQRNGDANVVSSTMTRQLQAINLVIDVNDDSNLFNDSLHSWLFGVTGAKRDIRKDGAYILWLQVLPARSGLDSSGIYTWQVCTDEKQYSLMAGDVLEQVCDVWGQGNVSSTPSDMARIAGVRTGEVSVRSESTLRNVTTSNGELKEEWFNVTAVFNDHHSIQPANSASFLLQVLLLFLVLAGLSVLGFDAGRLVLDPLRRMLRIVALYARNPLAPAPRMAKAKKRGSTTEGYSDDEDDDDVDAVGDEHEDDQLGTYETEQLITAVSKITDLLRKCWGVAGAGIISSNLAKPEDGFSSVFNPLVPGRSVYALFAFAAISGFDNQLRALGGEIMILINDVAAVLHGEVFRWGFGDSGQCNKNLGSSFLMVFRIGDVKEVREKRDRAQDVVFAASTTEKRRNRASMTGKGIRRARLARGGASTDASDFGAGANNGIRLRRKKTPTAAKNRKDELALASLPGISSFTDRALIGMLKTFAGIYRDQKLLSWKNDFRLGAGVGAFSVDMIFGMDAGWAVEGAVGSEYKIDATYLSPHVNMASRMMSACKQYGVNILVSQAVEELLSQQARSKLRHLDTVMVKGSSVRQRIFTYDARHKGVDFFLFEKSDDQADLDSDRYTASIWHTDQDLSAMRQHVTDEFEEEFNKGRNAYLAGNWTDAIQHLRGADDIMVETIMEQGYIEDELNDIKARIMDGEDAHAEEERMRNEMGDGPSRCLIAFMEREGGKAPHDWSGFRPLTSK